MDPDPWCGQQVYPRASNTNYTRVKIIYINRVVYLRKWPSRRVLNLTNNTHDAQQATNEGGRRKATCRPRSPSFSPIQQCQCDSIALSHRLVAPGCSEPMGHDAGRARVPRSLDGTHDGRKNPWPRRRLLRDPGREPAHVVHPGRLQHCKPRPHLRRHERRSARCPHGRRGPSRQINLRGCILPHPPSTRLLRTARHLLSKRVVHDRYPREMGPVGNEPRRVNASMGILLQGR